MFLAPTLIFPSLFKVHGSKVILPVSGFIAGRMRGFLVMLNNSPVSTQTNITVLERSGPDRSV